MDPIHPILPQKPNIPPVTEPPRVGRIDRRDPRRDTPQGRDRDKDDDDSRPGYKRDQDVEAWDEDNPGPHIDITA
jgi:hypothetical protein